MKKGLCSKKCSYDYTHLELICDYCGKTFIRLASQLLTTDKRNVNGRTFCSKQCFGKFIANTYGFKAHPENRLSGRLGITKYSNEILQNIKQRLQSGQSMNSILRELSIPIGTCTVIKNLIKNMEDNNG
jgi:hypothetical protein